MASMAKSADHRDRWRLETIEIVESSTEAEVDEEEGGPLSISNDGVLHQDERWVHPRIMLE